MKLRLFRTNIYSMLLYASSTWKATVPVFRKRQAFINSYLCYVSSVKSSLIHYQMKKFADELARHMWTRMRIGSTLRKGGNSIAILCHVVEPIMSG